MLKSLFRIGWHSCRMQKRLLVLLLCGLAATFYFLRDPGLDYDWIDYLASKIDFRSAEIVDGYLVWNPKCRLKSRNPLDPSIAKFIRKEKYQSCTSTPLLSKITREPDGKIYLVTIPEQVKRYKYITCCYAIIHRPIKSFKDDDKNLDSTVQASECENFEDIVLLNNTVEVVLVRCRSSSILKPSFTISLNQLLSSAIYSNVHAVLNPLKVRNKLLNASNNNNNQGRKLSILVIGLDSVSRLNFQRTMPLTKEYLDKRGWFEMRGYNKIADNTYPNLMAILAGLSDSMSSITHCNPYKAYLNNCPIIWNAFRDAGYITGYGEDVAQFSTFNYLKYGFAEPPTDYYIRPYILASEKFLSTTLLSDIKYCTGPESGFFRVLNYAQKFAQTFINQPYFGFFWTNSISHNNLNTPSSVDDKFLTKLQEMDKAGVMNDSMVVMLSDHGMRFGDFRGTDYGWYEDRLPAVYISLPPWFREQNPEAHRALSVNRNRLTSPYDLYETFRDILSRSWGIAQHGKGCLNCTSLLNAVPNIRSCSDAGIDEHWCVCSDFRYLSNSAKIVLDGAKKFVKFVNDLVKDYTKDGNRLCEKLQLAAITQASQMEITKDQRKGTEISKIFLSLEVTPGEAKYEVTADYDGKGNYVVREHDISRIDSYHQGSMCLKEGKKMFCICIT